jgi:hypothetical protein
MGQEETRQVNPLSSSSKVKVLFFLATLLEIPQGLNKPSCALLWHLVGWCEAVSITLHSIFLCFAFFFLSFSLLWDCYRPNKKITT